MHLKRLSPGLSRRVVWYKYTDVSDVPAASIIGVMIKVYQTTRRNISEDSHLHNRHRENLKARMNTFLSIAKKIISPIKYLQSVRCTFLSIYELQLVVRIWAVQEYLNLAQSAILKLRAYNALSPKMSPH
jgi:hypothetical protein